MEYIPERSQYLLIEPIEKDSHYFLHETNTDFRLKINKQTKYLLELIDGRHTIVELTNLFNSHFNLNTSSEEVHQVIKEKFEPYGIVKTEEVVRKKDRAEYLKLRFTLIPSHIVSATSSIFQHLVVDKIGYLITTLVIALTAFYAFTITMEGFLNFITPANLLLYLPLTILSLLLHELGHASACKKFNITPGSIGLGFYILSPVFYADVSDAWKITPRKRIIVNIAGMYFQLLLSCILIIIYFFTVNSWILYVSFWNILGFLSNLNPFVRYDGYWIVSDLLQINNLMEKANQKFKETMVWFKNRRLGSVPVKTSTDKFLFAYFFINKAVVLAFLLSIILFDADSVIYFPKKLIAFTDRFLNRFESISFAVVRDFIFYNFISIIFYMLLWGVVKKFWSDGILKLKRFAGLEV